MQVVMMAGGEGTRLRPLTCDRPKPLVPVCGKPVLTYALEQLVSLGVKEAWLTLGYMAGAIQQEYGAGEGLGLHLRSVVEPEPRGTAGGVAALPLDSDRPILVLSGDALTDFDLAALLAFHRQRCSKVTLALARVPNPVAYGVVLTTPEGRIHRFLEKPTREESFSDLVNTGIYVLEPDVLAGVPRDCPYDFAKDLFPRLLAAGVPMYGWEAGGYWCDIGDLDAYVQANLDLLSGRTRLRPPGREVAPGLWLDGDADLEPGVEVRGPAYIGPGSRVQRGARLAEGVVLGAGTLIEPHATLKRTVLGRENRIGSRAALRGVAAGDGVRVGAGANLYEGVSLGSGACISQAAEVRPGVRIWPGRWVAPGAQASRNLVWATGTRQHLQDGALTGRLGVEITAEDALRYAAALAAALPPGALVIGSDPGGLAPLLRDLLIGGIRLTGRPIIDLGRTLPQVTPWAVARRGAAGGLHVYRDGATLRIAPWAAGGRPLARDLLRKLEQGWRDYGLKLPPREPGGMELWTDSLQPYLHDLAAEVEPELIRQRGVTLSLRAAPETYPLLQIWAAAMGLQLLAEGEEPEEGGAGGSGSGPLLRAGLSPLGSDWWLAGPSGGPLPTEELQALTLLLAARYLPHPQQVPIPTAAPVALEALCSRWGRQWRRCDPAELPAPDPLQILTRLADQLARSGQGLAELLQAVPPLGLAQGTITLPWEGRPRLLRLLAERYGAGAQPLAGGMRLTVPGGCTLTVLPVPDQPLCRIYAEAGDPHLAEEALDHLRGILGTLAREV